MKILGIDSSGLTASVAIIEDDITIAEYNVNYKKTHSQTLLPMLNEITEMTGQDLHDIDAIAVAAGPGSFTGLRIGSATAKGLALALNKPIIPVPTVDGLAYSLYGSDSLVCPIMDARRSQTYTGLYQFVEREHGYKMECLIPQCAVAIDVILDKINEMKQKVIFLGDGVPVFKERIEEKLKVDYFFAPSFYNRQRASTVAALGICLFQEGIKQTATEHAPEYLRLSQAERERNEAKNDSNQKAGLSGC